MNLSSVFRVLKERWWVAGLVLLVTAAGVYWIVSTATDRYEAYATLLLVTPDVVGSDDEPSTAQQPDLILDPAVVSEIAGGDGFLSRLGSNERNVDYSITPVGGGVLRVEARSDSEDVVLDTAAALIDEIRRVAEQLDESDPQRAGEVSVLSQPRFARERTITDREGNDQTEYYSVGSVYLAISEEFRPSTPPNPYTASDGTLRVIQEASSDPAAREEILAGTENEQASFEIGRQSRDPVPLLYVTTSAATPQATMDTLDSVVSFLDSDLADRQASTGADESTWLELQRLVFVEEAEKVEARLGRPIAAVVVLGVVAALSLALLIDSLVSGPVGRRSTLPSEGEDTGKPEKAESGRTRAS